MGGTQEPSRWPPRGPRAIRNPPSLPAWGCWPPTEKGRRPGEAPARARLAYPETHVPSPRTDMAGQGPRGDASRRLSGPQ